MKNTLLLMAVCTALSCQAEEAAPAAPAAASAASADLTPPRGRCPFVLPSFRSTAGYESLSVLVRFRVRADGHIENVRVEGKAPREYKRAVVSAYEGSLCQPAETDKGYASTLSFTSKKP